MIAYSCYNFVGTTKFRSCILSKQAYEQSLVKHAYCIVFSVTLQVAVDGQLFKPYTSICLCIQVDLLACLRVFSYYACAMVVTTLVATIQYLINIEEPLTINSLPVYYISRQSLIQQLYLVLKRVRHGKYD